MIIGAILKRIFCYPRSFLERNFLGNIFNEFLVGIYEKILWHTQYLPPIILHKMQIARLFVLIKNAKKNSSFYREHYKSIHTYEDFLHSPPVTKLQMRELIANDLVINSNLIHHGFSQWTSGSTGVPFYFLLDRKMLPLRQARLRRMLRGIGKKAGDVVYALMPKDYYGGGYKTPGVSEETVFVQCADLDDIDRDKEKLFALLNKKNAIFYTRPSYLLRLSQLIEIEKRPSRPRAFIVLTEQLVPEVRKFIEERLHAPVFNFYASNETTGIAFECEFHEGLHVQSELVFVEIVNKYGSPVQPGEIGDIAVTIFDNEVMPFIRYKTGDRGYWVREPCPCGRTLPRIEVMGREISTFILPSGQYGYFFTLIKPIISLIKKIKQYHVTRYTRDEFLIEIVPTEFFGVEDEKLILNKFMEYIGSSAKVSLKIVDKIENSAEGKQYGFTNLCPDYLT